MTWGDYFFFYECPECGKKYRYPIDLMSDPDYGACPDCHGMGKFGGETKDIKQGETKFSDYEYV